MAPGQAAAKPAPAAAPAAAGATVAVDTAVDGGWPRVYDLPSGGTILLYQPQIATWDKQTRMVAYSAVSLRTQGAEKPVLGSIKLEADTRVALDERLVNFQNLKITEANFKELAKERVAEVVAQITKAFPNEERVIALDRILVNVDKSKIVPKTVEGIKADPPTIFFSKTPAVIVNLDGEPIWSPIKENDLRVRRQHQLGPVPARADGDLLPAERHQLAEDARPRQGPLGARRRAAGQLRQAPGRGELEGRQGEPARQGARRRRCAEGLRQQHAGGAPAARRRAEAMRP